jgi:hypothetical protein
VSVSSNPAVKLAASSGPQYFVIDDTNGDLASTAADCPVSFTTALTGVSNTIALKAISSPGSLAEGSVGFNDANGVTLSEAGCSAANPDVSLSSTVGTVFVQGGGGSNSRLDLALDAAAPVTIDPRSDTTADPGTVTGFASGGFSQLQFSGQEIVVGPNSGQSTFNAGSASGVTLTGKGASNTLDASGNTVSTVITMSAGSPCSGQDEMKAAGVTECFSDVSTVRGATASTDFQADAEIGITFLGSIFHSNRIDLSAVPASGTAPLLVHSAAGTVTSGSKAYLSFTGVASFTGSSDGNTTFDVDGGGGGFNFQANPGTPNNTADFSTVSTSANSPLTISMQGTATGGNTHLTDTFGGIQHLIGTSSGYTTFDSGSSLSGESFAGQGGVGNTLDLSGQSATANSPLSVDVSTGTASASGETDLFSGIQDFDGSSAGDTTFVPGQATPIAFTGEGSDNTLDLTDELGFTTLMVAANGDTPASPTMLTSAGGVQNLDDSFSDVQTFEGASAIPTDFQPGPDLAATPSVIPLFVGHDTAPGGSVLDLSQFVSPDGTGQSLSDLDVALAGNSSADPGQVTATVNGSPVAFAQFAAITTATGSSSLPTSLSPGSVNDVVLHSIPRAGQTISFTSTPPAHAKVGSSYTVSATGGGSGNPVAFSLDSASTHGACTLSGQKVSFHAAGTCVVDATQAGSDEYLPAARMRQHITIPLPPPRISSLKLGASSFPAKTGTSLSLELSESARVLVTITGTVPGHVVNGRCVPGGTSGPTCTVAEHKSLSFSGASGANRFRLRVPTLPRGHYSGRVFARNSAGATSQPLLFNFRITS